MSKVTATKLDRLYVEGAGKNAGQLLRRFDEKPVGQLHPIRCKANCGKPLMAASGQIANYHKECRKAKKDYKAIIKR